MLERAMLNTGRLSRLSVMARDVPGSLARIAQIVAQTGANVERVDHERGLRAISGQVVKISLEVQTRDAQHLEELLATLASAGFEVGVN
jgi:threonine dehydratase